MKKIILETDDGTVITFYQDRIVYQTMSGHQFVLSFEEFGRLMTGNNL